MKPGTSLCFCGYARSKAARDEHVNGGYWQQTATGVRKTTAHISRPYLTRYTASLFRRDNSPSRTRHDKAYNATITDKAASSLNPCSIGSRWRAGLFRRRRVRRPTRRDPSTPCWQRSNGEYDLVDEDVAPCSVVRGVLPSRGVGCTNLRRFQRCVVVATGGDPSCRTQPVGPLRKPMSKSHPWNTCCCVQTFMWVEWSRLPRLCGCGTRRAVAWCFVIVHTCRRFSKCLTKF